MTREEIFKLPVMRHDLGASIPLGEYFYQLFTMLWNENESFNAKRPWGNSGWDYDVYVTLIKHGLISGSLDEDDYIESFNIEEASQYVLNEILNPVLSQMICNNP